MSVFTAESCDDGDGDAFLVQAKPGPHVRNQAAHEWLVCKRRIPVEFQSLYHSASIGSRADDLSRAVDKRGRVEGCRDFAFRVGSRLVRSEIDLDHCRRRVVRRDQDDGRKGEQERHDEDHRDHSFAAP